MCLEWRQITNLESTFSKGMHCFVFFGVSILFQGPMCPHCKYIGVHIPLVACLVGPKTVGLRAIDGGTSRFITHLPIRAPWVLHQVRHRIYHALGWNMLKRYAFNAFTRLGFTYTWPYNLCDSVNLFFGHLNEQSHHGFMYSFSWMIATIYRLY